MNSMTILRRDGAWVAECRSEAEAKGATIGLRRCVAVKAWDGTVRGARECGIESQEHSV